VRIRDVEVHHQEALAAPRASAPHVLDDVVEHALLEAHRDVALHGVVLPPLRRGLDLHVPLEHVLQPVARVELGVLRHQLVVNLLVRRRAEVEDVGVVPVGAGELHPRPRAERTHVQARVRDHLVRLHAAVHVRRAHHREALRFRHAWACVQPRPGGGREGKGVGAGLDRSRGSRSRARTPRGGGRRGRPRGLRAGARATTRGGGVEAKRRRFAIARSCGGNVTSPRARRVASRVSSRVSVLVVVARVCRLEFKNGAGVLRARLATPRPALASAPRGRARRRLRARFRARSSPLASRVRRPSRRRHRANASARSNPKTRHGTRSRLARASRFRSDLTSRRDGRPLRVHGR
jgi:hypothetical protein